jgi:hypothetical protein
MCDFPGMTQQAFVPNEGESSVDANAAASAAAFAFAKREKQSEYARALQQQLEERKPTGHRRVEAEQHAPAAADGGDIFASLRQRGVDNSAPYANAALRTSIASGGRGNEAMVAPKASVPVPVNEVGAELFGGNQAQVGFRPAGGAEKARRAEAAASYQQVAASSHLMYHGFHVASCNITHSR